MTDKQKRIEQIYKLIKISKGDAGTEPERKNAKSRALRMMKKYSISKEEVLSLNATRINKLDNIARRWADERHQRNTYGGRPEIDRHIKCYNDQLFTVEFNVETDKLDNERIAFIYNHVYDELKVFENKLVFVFKGMISLHNARILVATMPDLNERYKADIFTYKKRKYKRKYQNAIKAIRFFFYHLFFKDD